MTEIQPNFAVIGKEPHGKRVYPFDTKGLQTFIPNFQYGFDDNADLRNPDGSLSKAEWSALTKSWSSPAYTPPEGALFECASLSDTVSLVLVEAGSYSYPTGTNGEPPFVRGIAGRPGFLFVQNHGSADHLKLAAAHEIGHALGLSTADDDEGRHDAPPYSLYVEKDIPNQQAGQKPADAFAGSGVAGTPYREDAEKAIMSSGSPDAEGKLPWLHGRWMRHEDWNEANTNARGMINE